MIGASVSVQGALLGLAWAVIVLLAFGLAGLSRQVRELRAVVVEGFGTSFLTGTVAPALHPGPGRSSTVVLVLDGPPGPEVARAFAAAALEYGGRTDFKVLTRDAASARPVDPGIPRVQDGRAFELLRLPWYPALVHVGPDGALVDAAPAGSPDAVRGVIGRFHTEMVASPRRG